jgi:hypothetical protein
VYSQAGLLDDMDAEIRGYALGEIGAEVALGYLLQARHDSSARIRANAAADTAGT